MACRCIKPRHLSLFYRRMAAMAASGMRAPEAVKALADAGASTSIGHAARTAHEALVQGVSLGEALAKGGLSHLKAVPADVFESDSKAAARLFRGIAAHVDRGAAIRKAVRDVTVYPAVIGCVLVLVLLMLMIFVVPVFSEMFASMGGVLPMPTRVVISLAAFLRPAAPVLVIAGVALLILLIKKPGLLYAVLDKCPVIGRANRSIAAAEFMGTASMLVDLGVEADAAMRAAAPGVTNTYLAEKLGAMAGDAGHPTGMGEMVRALLARGYIDSVTAQMLEAGLNTGTVETALAETSTVLFEDAEAAYRGMVTYTTPAAIVAIGVIVGFIVIAMYLPIFTMVSFI